MSESSTLTHSTQHTLLLAERDTQEENSLTTQMAIAKHFLQCTFPHCTQIDFHWDNCRIFYHRSAQVEEEGEGGRTHTTSTRTQEQINRRRTLPPVEEERRVESTVHSSQQRTVENSAVGAIAPRVELLQPSSCLCLRQPLIFRWSVAALVVTWEAFVIKHLILRKKKRQRERKRKRAKGRKEEKLPPL